MNKQIADLKAKLKQKDKEIENNNNSNKVEINKIKNEKDKEINELKQENKKMKNYKNEGQLLQKKEQEFLERMKKLDEKEKNVLKLYEQSKNLENKNASLEKNKLDLEKQKENLIKEIKQYEKDLSRKKKELQEINNQIKNSGNQPESTKNKQEEKKDIDPPPRKPTDIIATYDKPTLIGLNNIGSTCYKNSVLQCLSQTKDLTNYFLREENKEKIINNNIAKKHNEEYQLCPIYYELIKNLWNKNASNKSFSPINFMKTIEKMTKNDTVQFTLNEAGDAKDFIIYILERLHTELKKPVSNKALFNQANPETSLNQYDKKNALIHFISEFQKETSIISDLFYGFNETTNVCQFCKFNYNSKGQVEPICYNYGIFNILIFPLDEVRKYRDKFYQSKDAGMVSLYECFCYNQKSDYFTGDNKNYCNICRQLYDSVYTSQIFIASNILIMILNRGKGNIYKIKIDFSLQIDISDFVLQKDTKELYNLYGVITHIGESGPNAHFVAACRSPVDGNWYRYNDAMVTPISNFQKDVYDFGMPYILFYEKQKQK